MKRTFKIVCRLAVGVVLMALSGCGGGSSGIVPSPVPREVIVCERQTAIYAMAPDGGSLRFITDGFGPKLSADGKKVVFYAPGSNSMQIFVCNFDGSGRKQITTTGGVNPAWNPDGQQIVYRGTADDVSENGLFLINVDGTLKKHLTFNKVDDYPSFAPDGQRVAFFRGSLYSVDLNGGDEKPIARGGYVGHDWSPDGKSVVYADGAGDKYSAIFDIFLQRTDARDPLKLTNGGSFKAQPSFSPDGQKVVYADNAGSTKIPEGSSATVYNLYVLDLATKEVKKITTDGKCRNPDWGRY